MYIDDIKMIYRYLKCTNIIILATNITSSWVTVFKEWTVFIWTLTKGFFKSKIDSVLNTNSMLFGWLKRNVCTYFIEINKMLIKHMWTLNMNNKHIKQIKSSPRKHNILLLQNIVLRPHRS